MPSYSTQIENIIRDAGIISNAAIKKKMKALGKQNIPTIRKALKTMLKKGTLLKEGASYRLKHATSAEANVVYSFFIVLGVRNGKCMTRKAWPDVARDKYEMRMTHETFWNVKNICHLFEIIT